DAALHDRALAIEGAFFLALGDIGADAGLGEEGGDSRAAGTQTFGHGPLWIELDLQFAGEELLSEQFVLADVRSDHLFDLPGLQEQAEAGAVDASIVGDASEVFHAGIAQLPDPRRG